MNAQQLLSATIPWELLFVAVPLAFFYAFFKVRERITRQREEKIGRRKHFFS